MRLVLSVGAGGPADGRAVLALLARRRRHLGRHRRRRSRSTAATKQAFWGPGSRSRRRCGSRSIVVLALFGSIGDGSTPVELSTSPSTCSVDQTRAARLLPLQVLPAEKLPIRRDRAAQLQPRTSPTSLRARRRRRPSAGTTYTLALADNHRLVECANAAAITVTVPTDAAVFFPLGARIEIAQTGAGQITVAGAGITLRLPSGKQAKTRLQYSIIALTKRGADEWILSGDLA